MSASTIDRLARASRLLRGRTLLLAVTWLVTLALLAVSAVAVPRALLSDRVGQEASGAERALESLRVELVRAAGVASVARAELHDSQGALRTVRSDLRHARAETAMARRTIKRLEGRIAAAAVPVASGPSSQPAPPPPLVVNFQEACVDMPDVKNSCYS